MKELDKKNFDLFKKNSLLHDVSDKIVENIYSISKEITLEPGSILIQEGDKSEEIFFILEGSLEIFKYDPQHHQVHVIDQLFPGDTVGEVAFLDHGIRSASVKAKTFCRLRKFSFTDFQFLLGKNPQLINDIFFPLSKKVTTRFRTATDAAFIAVQEKLEESKIRVNLGVLLIFVICILTTSLFAFPFVKYLLTISTNTSYVAFPVLGIILFVILIIIKKSKLPLQNFGITLRNWKKSIFEGFFFSIPVLIGMLVFKWAFVRYGFSSAQHDLFEPYSAFAPSSQNLKSWIILNLFYFLFAFVQELFARGILQGLLMDFLTGKRKMWLSIFISSLIFSSVHVVYSEVLAINAFFFSMYFGWLYTRHRNLLGPWVAHGLLGIWGLSVIGVGFFD